MQDALRSAAKTALVTGAASGLGREIALRLGRDGWHVVVTDVDTLRAERVAAEINSSGGHSLAMKLDVASAEQWIEVRSALQRNFQRLDLLVNNAGIGCAGEVGEFSLDDWQTVIDVNLRGAINGCHTMIDWLKRNPAGAHIVNVASIAAVASGPTMAAYNATKAGVISLSETLYVELRMHNVGVTVVCPGFFPTNILASGRFCNEAHRTSAESYMRQAAVTAEQVAAATVRAIGRRKLYVVLPLRARVLWRLKRLAPRLLLRIIAWHYGRTSKGTSAVRSTAAVGAQPVVQEETTC